MKLANKIQTNKTKANNSNPNLSQLDWESFINGNRNALKSIYVYHLDHLFNYGCQICGNRDLVKDCIQDVFHELIKYQSKLGAVTSVRAYLLKSLRRKIIKTLKHQSAKHEKQIKFKPFEIDVPYEENLILMEGGEENRTQLKYAIEKLSPKQRQVIMLYFYEGYTYEEIAEIMDMKLTKSARKLVYKGIKAIKEVFLKTHSDFTYYLLLAYVCIHSLFEEIILSV